jgi:hypothetical protein
VIKGIGTNEWFFIPFSTASMTRKSWAFIVRITDGSNFMVQVKALYSAIEYRYNGRDMNLVFLAVCRREGQGEGEGDGRDYRNNIVIKKKKGNSK